MNKPELLTLLKAGNVSVSFTKKSDGAKRVMKCTLNSEKLDAYERKTNQPITDMDGLVTVWDTEKNGFRAIPLSNITDVNGVTVSGITA